MLEQRTSRPSIVLRGIPASGGIGIGKAFIIKEEALSYAYSALCPKTKSEKRSRVFRQAVALKPGSKLIKPGIKVLKFLGNSHGALIDAHLLILEDALFTKDVEKKRIAQELINAEAALVAVLDAIGLTFDKLGDEYFPSAQRRHHGRRQARDAAIFWDVKDGRLAQLSDRSIVIAHDLGPSDTLALRDDLVEGFATNIGGRTSHTAILAQGLEIPAVVGLKEVTESRTALEI